MRTARLAGAALVAAALAAGCGEPSEQEENEAVVEVGENLDKTYRYCLMLSNRGSGNTGELDDAIDEVEALLEDGAAESDQVARAVREAENSLRNCAPQDPDAEDAAERLDDALDAAQ